MRWEAAWAASAARRPAARAACAVPSWRARRRWWRPAPPALEVTTQAGPPAPPPRDARPGCTPWRGVSTSLRERSLACPTCVGHRYDGCCSSDPIALPSCRHTTTRPSASGEQHSPSAGLRYPAPRRRRFTWCVWITTTPQARVQTDRMTTGSRTRSAHSQRSVVGPSRVSQVSGLAVQALGSG